MHANLEGFVIESSHVLQAFTLKHRIREATLERQPLQV